MKTTTSYLRQIHSKSAKRSKITSNQEKTRKDDNTDDMSKLSNYFLTGVNTYLSEIARNKTATGRRDLRKFADFNKHNKSPNLTSQFSFCED